MYILIISRGYPTEKYKMNGIFEFDQAKALAACGCKVVFAVIDLRSIRRMRKFGIDSFIKDGVQIEAINLPCGNIPKRMLYAIGELGLKILYKIIKKKYGQPDIIHGHFTQMGYIITRALRESDIPIILTEHSSLIHNKTIDNRLYEAAKYSYENADRVIAVSTSLSASIYKNFNIRAVCIPNIVNTEMFTYKVNNRDNLFRIISTGSLIKTKRMDLLIDAFYKAFSKNINIHLYIFGDGVEKISLERKIKEYNLEDNIRLMGLQTRNVIAEYLQNSDCFVLASQSETFGVAYIEALAVGVPVIATKCGGPEDFINNSNGILVEVDDVESLSEALKYIYNNICNYNREEISRDTKSRFSNNIIGNRLIDVYRQTISERELNN